MPGPWLATVASIDSTTRSEAMRSQSSSCGVFLARRRSSATVASTIRAEGRFAAEHFLRIGGEEGALDADHGVLAVELAEPLDHRGHRALRSPGLDEFRHPELAELPLVVLHRVADIGRVLRLAADIDEERQVAGKADRVEMGEEEETIGVADQVLDVMLGGNDEDVDPGPLHERIEQLAVERESMRERRSRLSFRRVRP